MIYKINDPNYREFLVRPPRVFISDDSWHTHIVMKKIQDFVDKKEKAHELRARMTAKMVSNEQQKNVSSRRNPYKEVFGDGTMRRMLMHNRLYKKLGAESQIVHIDDNHFQIEQDLMDKSIYFC